jgi:hypothetical protein
MTIAEAAAAAESVVKNFILHIERQESEPRDRELRRTLRSATLRSAPVYKCSADLL